MSGKVPCDECLYNTGSSRLICYPPESVSRGYPDVCGIRTIDAQLTLLEQENRS